MKTILVTGGAGYVGSVLVPALLDRGHRVRVLDIMLYGNTLTPHTRLSLMRGDIRKANALRQALGGVDTVIHLACISNDPSFELDPSLGRSVNHSATLGLINLARKSGRVRRFIYASSSSVYGVKKEKNVTESLSLEPLTDYSKYKALCEEYLFHNAGAMVPVIIRPATVCGYSPRMRLDLTINILAISALVNRSMTVFGGKQKRPNIHITDMCRAYLALLQAPEEKVAGKIFNAGYQNYTILEIARIVKRVLADPRIAITIKPTHDTRSYHISSVKIRRELGFAPTHTIEDAIRDIKTAYDDGLLPSALTDKKYYNVRVMKNFV